MIGSAAAGNNAGAASPAINERLVNMLPRISPGAKTLHICRRPVPQPPVQLRHFLQLLPARARHAYELAIQLRQRRHVAPELFELGHGEDVLVPLAPPL